MTATPESPVETLRRAAEAAQSLPPGVRELANAAISLAREWGWGWVSEPGDVVPRLNTEAQAVVSAVLALAEQQQADRDAAVAVIREAFNTAHDIPPTDAPFLEKHRRHDGHQHHYACWTCTNEVDQLAPHIVDALASASLLASTPPPKPRVTRVQVRAAVSELFRWNHELPEPRFTLHHVTQGVDREPYGALVDEVLHHLGIRVQDGGRE